MKTPQAWLVGAALLLGGCRLLEPDYVEISPYVQHGDHNFTRPVSSFDEETYGLAFTVGWLVGAQYEAMENLSRLDVSKAGQLTLRDEPRQTASPVTVQVDNKGAGEVTVEQESAIPVEITKLPKDWEGAKVFLAWTAGILILAAAAILLQKSGLRLPPIFPKKNGSDKDKNHD